MTPLVIACIACALISIYIIYIYRDHCQSTSTPPRLIHWRQATTLATRANQSINDTAKFWHRQSFDSAIEDWTSYEERFRLFFEANDIKDNGKQLAIFLTTCGAATYKLLRSLAAPKKPADVSLTELWKLAAEHYHPQPSLAVQRFRFNSRICQAGESVAAYVAELRQLSEHCDFDDTLEDMLRDRIVCGIQDQRTQRRLLAESKLTLKKAFEIAQAAESADTQVKELQHTRTAEVHAVSPTQFRPFRTPVRTGPSHSVSDNRASTPPHCKPLSAHPPCNRQSFTPSQRTPQRPSPQPRTPCTRCGRMHWASTCKFRQAVCHNCGKRGHIQATCRSPRSTGRHRQQEHKTAPRAQTPSKVHSRSVNDDQVFLCAQVH